MVLIVIDGLDAAGKNTQAEMLAKRIQLIGKTYLIRSHPNSDNPLGHRARNYLYIKGRKAHIAASLFYLADVYLSIFQYSWRHVDYVIFVRYLLGTAYLPSPLHKIAYRFFSCLVPNPKNMIYLNVSPNVAESRLKKNRNHRERFETFQELKKVSHKAWDLVSTGGWIIIDGDRSPNEIHEEIISIIKLA